MESKSFGNNFKQVSTGIVALLILVISFSTTAYAEESMVTHQLELYLILGVDDDNILWVDRMPSTEPAQEQNLELTLLVQWPYRSIWQGECPSSQTYDFFIEREGNIIWQWSADKVFKPVITSVNIPGGDPIEFATVSWSFSPEEIEEGEYSAQALFIATNQTVSQEFEIMFAY